MSKQRFPIGIDLGTTFSSLSYVDDQNRVQTVRLPDGGFVLASAVFFRSPTEIVVGQEALDNAFLEPARVARAFKRHMGDPDYAFVCDGKAYRPEELSAMVLKKLVTLAAGQLGPIEEVVISVPFVFDEVRRRATIDAARIAGLRVLDLVDEPVAAVLAYAHTIHEEGGLFADAELNELFGEDNVLVYDLGGGTFDATVTRLSNDGTFEVLATDGDERLGGEDWDNVLLQIVWDAHRARHPGRAISDCPLCRGFEIALDPRRACRGGDLEEGVLLQELRQKVVEAKKALSERKWTELTYTWKGEDHFVKLTRGEFKQRAEHLMARTVDTVSEMLARKEMTWSHIDRLLMVGGSSRMVMVIEALEQVTKHRLDMSLPPDTAISEGAALYAALRRGGRQMRVKRVVTVNSHSLGLRVRDKDTNKIINNVLLRANEPTLKKVMRTYRVVQGRGDIKLSILLGDSPDPQACKLLGEGRLANIPAESSPKDVVRVTFCFLPDGLLQVSGSYHPEGGGHAQQVEFEVQVEGKMSEKAVNEAEASLRGISLE